MTRIDVDPTVDDNKRLIFKKRNLNSKFILLSTVSSTKRVSAKGHCVLS